MFTSSSSIETHQKNFRFLPGLHLAGLWSRPQLRSAKSSRSGDRDTCRAQPLRHPQIFDIADARVIGQLAIGLEKLTRLPRRIGLANAAYNRRWLAITDVSTWIKCVRAFIGMRERWS